MKNDEDNEKRGRNVLALIRHNFGETRTARAEFSALFERLPTSVWPWVAGNRQGIPCPQKERFEALLASGELRLVDGSSIDDYLRPGPKKVSAEKEPKRNEDLLALIWDVVKHKNLGHTALEALMSDTNFLERKRTPALLLRWAYHEGGVPKTYQEPFTNALVRSGIAKELLDYDDPHGLFDIRVSSFFAE